MVGLEHVFLEWRTFESGGITDGRSLHADLVLRCRRWLGLVGARSVGGGLDLLVRVVSVLGSDLVVRVSAAGSDLVVRVSAAGSDLVVYVAVPSLDSDSDLVVPCQCQAWTPTRTRTWWCTCPRWARMWNCGELTIVYGAKVSVASRCSDR
ncbi:hypothetical protein PF002_g24617 [Phytophthora fragariae]|uniref:Uncharacterized protein n=1 Tax=Phytophthora fragariae TaxID=53985 RepID=A0A6A3WTV6_9STRA|nr:hypothetical protein PF002_g24617 [Phytophthora fragariae]